MKNFFVNSDHHFGHFNILKYSDGMREWDTIEEHDEALIERHNSVVGKNDSVLFLGDLGFGLKDVQKAKRLNGIITMMLGNHDKQSMFDYHKAGIRIIAPGLRYNRSIIFTHYPVHESELNFGVMLNVHGHIHSKLIPDEGYMNVCIEYTKGYPVHISEITKKIA